VTEQLALLPDYLVAHMRLTLLALLVGTAFSVPVGVAISRVSWLEGPVLGLASVIQTIPSLALLAVMVPLLAALDLQSIGFLPAFIGLTLYSVLPILRNTVTGLANIDPALIEAARGVGMTPGQRLRRVELPLALPVIIAGVRTATVWTVGMATLSTPVGAPSLGNFIFSGLQTRNFAAILVGCVAAALLALVLDGLVRTLGLGAERRSRPLVAAASLVLALLCGLAAFGAARELLPGRAERVRIGAKTFTEQYILGAILAGQIERHTGARAEVVQSLGSTVAFDALRADQIDAYVDYSGTIWATILKRDAVGADRAQVLAAVGRDLQEKYGVLVVAALGFENAYALAMRDSEAQRLGIARISDLAPSAPHLSLGADYEFLSRPEWKALQRTYGLSFRETRSMDPTLMYQAAAQGDVDVITAFSTDGRIDALHLRVLDDDRAAIPPYDAIVLVSPRLAREQPDVVEALRALDGSIDAEAMRRMNLAVDDGRRLPSDVAAEFLASLGP